MKKLLIILMLFCATASATNYFVSPTGVDATGNGNIGTPYFTLEKAWSYCNAGDTIFVRGGTYTRITTDNLINKSSIVIVNYQNEVPVFDYSTLISTTNKTAIHIRNVDYLTLQGIKLTGLAQQSGGSVHYGIRLYDDVNYSTFRNIDISNMGGSGFVIGSASNNNLIIDCDSYYNSNPYSGYGEADGFQCANAGTNNTFQNCRAWYNSDDGFDFRHTSGKVTFTKCWSFLNGFIPGTSTVAGNGEGFKLGPKLTSPTSTDTLRVLTNCIAAGNSLEGFQCLKDEYYGFRSILYNNTAFQNGIGNNGRGFRFVDLEMFATFNNNLSYANGNATTSINANNIHDHNSWDSDLTVNQYDFHGFDISSLDDTRQSDGSLPVIEFLTLATDSDLIDAGKDVGLSYEGVAPDIGTYEYKEPSDTISPIVVLDSPYNTTSRGITIYAYVASDGGGTVTERGIVWNTSAHPTTSNNKQTAGTGLGVFKNVLSKLLSNTTYYLRGYAINEAGTAYSNEIVINTTHSSNTWDKGRIIRGNGTVVKF